MGFVIKGGRKTAGVLCMPPLSDDNALVLSLTFTTRNFCRLIESRVTSAAGYEGSGYEGNAAAGAPNGEWNSPKREHECPSAAAKQRHTGKLFELIFRPLSLLSTLFLIIWNHLVHSSRSLTHSLTNLSYNDFTYFDIGQKLRRKVQHFLHNFCLQGVQ